MSIIKRFVAPRFCRAMSNTTTFPCAKVNPIEGVVRSVHATEIFRSSFLSASRSPDRVSPSDLDDMIISKNTRPSLLLGLFEISGLVLGNVTNLSPPVVAHTITKVVNDVAIQQFNDGIRDIQQFGDPHNSAELDLKETIKYHRDLEVQQMTITANIKDTISLPLSATLTTLLKLSKAL